MPFVMRDESGAITSVSSVAGPDSVPIAEDDKELAAFIASLGTSAESISATDLDFVRVLEDVVELLVAKGVILFTDLPDSAREKMLLRQRLRSHRDSELNLIGDD